MFCRVFVVVTPLTRTPPLSRSSVPKRNKNRLCASLIFLFSVAVPAQRVEEEQLIICRCSSSVITTNTDN